MSAEEELAILKARLAELAGTWRDESKTPAQREMSNAYLLETCAVEIEQVAAGTWRP